MDITFRDALLRLILLLTANAVIAAAIVGVLVIIAKAKPATFAVIRRNFVGYFSSPTGYVFICVFMLLSAIAAFWPQAFFNDNLATLYQLNLWFAPVMLIFIPAITMGVWAEERHEGTDELLLTMPASDVDIVLGKYIAAALILTVALFFSQIVNFRVLMALAKGDIDLGLLFSTYIGYWLMGLAMIAIGMTASFLTGNLTIGYILGALFNAPLVFLMYIDRLVPGRGMAQELSNWSLAARFRDFGRGVLSLSSIFFFLAVIAIGIYISLILIGRRHWQGGKDGRSLLGHYFVRALSIIAIAFGATSFLTNHDLVRADLTSGRVNSLSPETRKILAEIPPDKPVLIEAYVGGSMPEEYVETRVNLINTLRELDAAGGSRINVQLHDNLEPFTEEAALAEQKYDIKPQVVFSRSRGRYEDEEFILGAAITSGLERVVVPFFGRGIPVEYELARSIKTVAGAKRNRLGVVNTDARMFGGFDMSSMQPQSLPKQRIIDELQKQYDVEAVDASQPLDEKSFDVLMVVQPSSLTPTQLENVMASIRNGVPTAIFEDPAPLIMRQTSGTGEPRPQGHPMFGGGSTEPKCDLTRLWDLLGIDMVGEPSAFGEGIDPHVIFQDYNPYPKVGVHITKEWVFVSPDAAATDDEALNVNDPITSGLKEVLCLYPGAIRNLGAKGLEFTPLMKTGEQSGWIRAEDCRTLERDLRALERAENHSHKKYILSARIKGHPKEPLAKGPAASTAPDTGTTAIADLTKNESQAAASSNETAGDDRRKEIHVIYTSDIDLLSSEFLTIREQNDDDINWRFDNVTFVLNTIDGLVGENDLIAIRKRQPRHSTLKRIDDETEEFRTLAKETVDVKEQEFQEELKAEQARVEQEYADFRKQVESLKQRYEAGDESVYEELRSAVNRLSIQEQLAQERINVKKERLQRDLDNFQEKNRRELQRSVERVQLRYKLDAVWPALVLPLVVGLGIWIVRAQKEREGVSESRRR